MARKKTAREKIDTDHASHGKAFQIPEHLQKDGGPRTMVVPHPRDVERLMKTPRKGRLITLGQIRAKLAKAAKADLCCPLTTGIFARLAAEAADEEAAAGAKRITPYWRTIRDNGDLVDKFPGGVDAQARRLRAEGFRISTKRKTPRVEDFARKSASGR